MAGRFLGPKFHSDAFIGLNAKGDHIGIHFFVRSARKQRLRRALEVNRNFGQTSSESLAGTDKERYAGPTPIIDIELHGRVGFGRGIWAHAGLLAVTRYCLAVHLAGTILST